MNQKGQYEVRVMEKCVGLRLLDAEFCSIAFNKSQVNSWTFRFRCAIYALHPPEVSEGIIGRRIAGNG
jgi:hypothetical protein